MNKLFLNIIQIEPQLKFKKYRIFLSHLVMYCAAFNQKFTKLAETVK